MKYVLWIIFHKSDCIFCCIFCISKIVKNETKIIWKKKRKISNCEHSFGCMSLHTLHLSDKQLFKKNMAQSKQSMEKLFFCLSIQTYLLMYKRRKDLSCITISSELICKSFHIYYNFEWLRGLGNLDEPFNYFPRNFPLWLIRPYQIFV